jgi:Ca2+-binding EF-hand superfamily protein
VEPISQEKFDKVVAAMFARADTNRDGMVTLAELQSLIDARREGVIRDRFKQIDTNHDGKIDIGEFIAWQQAMGSAAASDCSAYAGQGEIVPDALGPELGYSDKDRALAIAIEPLSPLVITRANTHYRAGITLDDLLAYENARFTAADTNHDGFLEQEEIAAMRQGGRGHGGGHHGAPDN